MVFLDDMNQTQEIERLQNALANLATVMAKIITNRVDQTFAGFTANSGQLDGAWLFAVLENWMEYSFSIG